MSRPEAAGPSMSRRRSAFNFITGTAFAVMAVVVAGEDFIPNWARAVYVGMIAGWLLLFAWQRHLEAELAKLTAQLNAGDW